jgi:hypothetical protein
VGRKRNHRRPGSHRHRSFQSRTRRSLRPWALRSYSLRIENRNSCSRGPSCRRTLHHSLSCSELRTRLPEH